MANKAAIAVGVGGGLLALLAAGVAFAKSKEGELTEEQKAELKRQQIIQGFFNTGRKIAATEQSKLGSEAALRSQIQAQLPQSVPLGAGGTQLSGPQAVKTALSLGGTFAAGGPVAGVVALSVFAGTFVLKEIAKTKQDAARLRQEFTAKLQQAGPEELAYAKGVCIERMSQWCGGYTPASVLAQDYGQGGFRLKNVQQDAALRAFFAARPRGLQGELHTGMVVPGEKNTLWTGSKPGPWKGGFLFPSPRVCNLMSEMGIMRIPLSCAEVPRKRVAPTAPKAGISKFRAARTITSFRG